MKYWEAYCAGCRSVVWVHSWPVSSSRSAPVARCSCSSAIAWRAVDTCMDAHEAVT